MFITLLFLLGFVYIYMYIYLVMPVKYKGILKIPLKLHNSFVKMDPCCTQWTPRLFSHDNNVVTALFNHQYCYNLWTRLSNNEQACSINIVFSCFNNREQPLLLHQCWTTLLKQLWTTLFVQKHCSAVITMLLQHFPTNNAVTTCADFLAV